MTISKKVPIIVSIVLLVIWGFLGYRFAVRIGDGVAAFMFRHEVTITEDVMVADKIIPAGSAGHARIYYSHRSQYIKDIESDKMTFRAYFSQDSEGISVYVSTGPESQLEQDQISIKKLENYHEIISEYNQKVKEEKEKWEPQCLLSILTGTIIAAVFSGLFWLLFFIVNKTKMHPVGFSIICSLYILISLGSILFASII